MGFEVPKEKLRMAGCGSYADVMNTLERAVSENRFIAAISLPPRMSMSAPMSAGACNSARLKTPGLHRLHGAPDRPPGLQAAAQLDEEAARK